MVAPNTRLSIRATDVTGQKAVRVRNLLPESTVGELVTGLVPRMQLPVEAEGRPLSYSARLERLGRHLSGSERLGEALQEDDEVMLSPSIDAG
jgi:hypothetical protein